MSAVEVVQSAEASEGRATRVITIAIQAMGGEGGGVLADWLVDLAEANGWYAQTTSVPGVAQRTGATIYYLEMFPEAAVPPGSRPVMALSPVPGEVDIVIASELMEAGRVIQRGIVTDDRTTLIASTHRVYSMTERTAMGDGRVDSARLLAGARAAARHLVADDFARLAEQTGSLISPVLYGALAATDRLPFSRAQFEATIVRGGVGVKSSLAAFAAGFEAGAKAAVAGLPAPAAAEAISVPASPAAQAPPLSHTRPAPPTGPRLAALAGRIANDFPAGCHATLTHGILRLADYQDVDYARSYLDRLAPFKSLVSANTSLMPVLDETARHLALWMSYEDAIRVADLKTRSSRFSRVHQEVKVDASQQLDISEYMHPRIEEIADTLPAAAGRWLLASRGARALLGPFVARGRVVRTSSIRGFTLLYAIAAMRGMRRRSLRFGIEQRRIDTWLAHVLRLSSDRPALAKEVARSQRLVKGYGDTHARGWANFSRILSVLPKLETRSDQEAALKLASLVGAALADEGGLEFDRVLATV